jgi:hypothetical protein
MKAFLHAMNQDGSDILGSLNATVTNEYKSYSTMMSYAILPFIRKHGNCHVGAFYNWTNRYGKADIDKKYFD